MMFVRGFILGLEIDFVAPSLSPLKKLEYDYDFCAMIPLQAQNSLKNLNRIKKIIIGGAKINPQLEKELKNIKTQVFETYGMTETITHIAAKRVGEPYFTVFPKVMLSQDDNQCLLIKAPSISPDIIVTNDIVEMISENQFIWKGRYDNIINSGGIKLIPEQIEEKLAPFIEERFFVTAIPDKDFGDKLVLIIEGENRPLEPQLFEVLDKYEKPKQVFFISEFKTTATGKIIRKETLQESKIQSMV
jgi:O-succinylbenzoic acid--CoA ligase